METKTFTIHRAADRMMSDLGWLKSAHTFSFGRHYDPNRMGYASLRVINDDRVQQGGGFGTHPHDNMEIFSYVLNGALNHRDSMGNEASLKRGDLQLMSAGSGITHSEFNGNPDGETHFLQIWIEPNVLNAEPTYQEAHFSDEDKTGVLRLMLSPDEAEGSLKIRQDARVYASILRDGQSLGFTLPAGRYGWLHVADGEITVDGQLLKAGDAVEFGPTTLGLSSGSFGEFILFDLA